MNRFREKLRADVQRFTSVKIVRKASFRCSLYTKDCTLVLVPIACCGGEVSQGRASLWKNDRYKAETMWATASENSTRPSR
jgi:hypothetical protein